MPFFGIIKITKNQYLCLKFSSGDSIKCSEDHPIMTIDGIVKAKHLDKDIEIITQFGGCFLVYKRLVRKTIDLYDVVDSGTRHLYYTNGIVSHNCEFLGSVHTLIRPEKLKSLVYRTPMHRNDEGLRVYERPRIDGKYVLVVDTSRGQGQDYHAFTVVDVTEFPYKLVATFRNNTIPPMLYPNVIYPVAKQYCNAYVLIEINDIGGQVADILHDELEYENILYVQTQGRKGQVVGGGFGGGNNSLKGVRTTTAVKRIGCSILKNLIEESKLVVEDFDVVDELCTFVAKAESYSAEDGHHDDLVMTLVLFSWLSIQPYFKDITGSDIRKGLFEDQMKILEEEMTPFGFFDDGSTPISDFTDNSGIAWNWGEKP